MRRMGVSKLRSRNECWAILWRETEQSIDGANSHLIGDPEQFGRTRLFKTRKQAQENIRANYNYIAKRTDLRRAPHGWRMPVPIKVAVIIEPA